MKSGTTCIGQMPSTRPLLLTRESLLRWPSPSQVLLVLLIPAGLFRTTLVPWTLNLQSPAGKERGICGVFLGGLDQPPPPLNVTPRNPGTNLGVAVDPAKFCLPRAGLGGHSSNEVLSRFIPALYGQPHGDKSRL